MQKQLTEGLLLNKNGNLEEAGYAFSLVRKYDRSQIKGKKWRIKEWDYYFIGNKHYGIALTVADNSYMAMGSVSFLNFDKKCETTKSPMKWFTFGKLKLPSTSKEGDIKFESKKLSIYFKHEEGKRHIIVSFKNFEKNKDLKADLYLEETNEGSMVIATPFKKNRHFYYNQKINMLKSCGQVVIGEEVYDFNEDSWGVLDWGRGVWTYSNTWLWSSLNGTCDGHRIGFNLGYGFGDTSNASENMLFFDDKAYKLEDVCFNIPKNKKGKDLFMEPWTFTSNKGDINLTFTPIIDRNASLNALVIKSIQHQVFGKFNGLITIDNQKVEIKDMLGFAEKVHNAW